MSKQKTSGGQSKQSADDSAGKTAETTSMPEKRKQVSSTPAKAAKGGKQKRKH